MAGHLGNDAGAQAQDGFGEQAFNISTYILDFMKDTFNTLMTPGLISNQPVTPAKTSRRTVHYYNHRD